MENKDLRYQVSSYFNEHKDQGMRECLCGVTLQEGDFEEMMSDVIRQIFGFCEDFPIKRGTWDVSYGDREDNKDILFITWQHDNDDRCFGIEVRCL